MASAGERDVDSLELVRKHSRGEAASISLH